MSGGALAMQLFSMGRNLDLAVGGAAAAAAAKAGTSGGDDDRREGSTAAATAAERGGLALAERRPVLGGRAERGEVAAASIAGLEFWAFLGGKLASRL